MIVCTYDDTVRLMYVQIGPEVDYIIAGHF